MSEVNRISVLIPCYNEKKFIGNTIDLVLKQDYPSELIEILVIDGMSSDGTSEIISEISKSNSNVRKLINKNKTVPFAFNLAIPEAKGEIIVILGAHSEIPLNYISVLVQKLNELGADNVGGLLETIAPDDSVKSRSIAAACSSKIGMGNSYFRVGAKEIIEVDTVPFGCYRKSIFDKVGLFDTELTRNQDDEFNARVKKAGGKIYLIPSVKLRYFSRDSFKKLWTMFNQYGIYKPLVSKKIGAPTTMRQLVPPLFVLSISILLILGFINQIFHILLLMELAMYESMVLISGAQMMKPGISISEIISFSYSIHIIHVAYGLGYLKGLLNYVIFGKKPVNVNLKSSR